MPDSHRADDTPTQIPIKPSSKRICATCAFELQQSTRATSTCEACEEDSCERCAPRHICQEDDIPF